MLHSEPRSVVWRPVCVDCQYCQAHVVREHIHHFTDVWHIWIFYLLGVWATAFKLFFFLLLFFGNEHSKCLPFCRNEKLELNWYLYWHRQGTYIDGHHLWHHIIASLSIKSHVNRMKCFAKIIFPESNTLNSKINSWLWTTCLHRHNPKLPVQTGS